MRIPFITLCTYSLAVMLVGCDPSTRADRSATTDNQTTSNAYRESQHHQTHSPQIVHASSSAIETDRRTEWRESILDACASHRRYARASPAANWSPLLCKAPPAVGATYSRSDDAKTHGSKLYYLYVKDYDHYARLTAKQGDPTEPPIGQTIVKEAWHPVAVEGPKSQPPLNETETVTVNAGDSRFGDIPPAAERDGVYYQPGRKGPLFLMQYLGRDVPATDNGWIYATLTPEGETITAIGRIESCVECHRAAPYGRLFGLAPSLRAENFEP